MSRLKSEVQILVETAIYRVFPRWVCLFPKRSCNSCEDGDYLCLSPVECVYFPNDLAILVETAIYRVFPRLF